MGWSTGLIDLDVSGSVCSRLIGIIMFRGESCCFPVFGEGCDSFQSGPSSQVNSSCFSNKGVVQIGAGCSK